MSINNYLRNETAQFLPTLKDGASLGNEVKRRRRTRAASCGVLRFKIKL